MKSVHLFALVLCFVLLVGCQNDDQPNRDTIGFFKENLSADITHTNLIKTFGEPDADKGSGIHIYVYKLSDRTEVWIGFTDHLMYANHLDDKQVLLEVIL